MEKITFKTSVFEVTLKKEEVKDIYEENEFLKDAILVLLNPKVADESDIPILSKDVKNDLKHFFMNKSNTYNKEFLEQIFE